MIADAMINSVYRIFMYFLGAYKPLDFKVDTTFFDTVTDLFAFIFYILPIYDLKPIISIIIALMGFRIIIVIIKTVWDVLPIL